MPFKLSDALSRDLLTQPETGMGYQVVEATLQNYRTEEGIAYNGELLFLGNETQNALRLSSYKEVLRTAQSSGTEIKALRVLGPREARLFRLTSAPNVVRKAEAGPAKDAPAEKTKANEVFKRFSAYENDRRVTMDKSLLPRSFATTEEDAKNVKTGSDAVSRYALPNPDPACYRFTIKPKTDTDIQRGTAAPAFGQPGGGAEVIFTNGTNVNSVTLPPDKLPDK